MSKIEWTEKTWNPTVGCTKVSQGCKLCYAKKMHKRIRGMHQKRGKHPKYADEFEVVKFWEEHLEQPLGWKTPRTIFVNSMSDLFHRDLSLEEIKRVFDVMREADWHTYQVLTKRAARLAEIAPDLPWPKQIWMGVSVEDASQIGRIEHLRTVPAAVRFLSVEPLLGPIPDLPLDGIDWVIVGGESGHGAREMDLDWVRDIRDQCVEAGVPFFLKQLGKKKGVKGKRGGEEAVLDGVRWQQMPNPTRRVLQGRDGGER